MWQYSTLQRSCAIFSIGKIAIRGLFFCLSQSKSVFRVKKHSGSDFCSLLSENSNALSYNTSGGSAPISLQSSKWSQKHGGFPRIFTFADARMTPLVPNPRGNYHWPTAILGFRRQFHPPGFWKKPKTLLKVYIKKTSRKNAEFLHGFMMSQYFIKNKHFFLPVRCIKCFICTK
jgi:hypothetical protein